MTTPRRPVHHRPSARAGAILLAVLIAIVIAALTGVTIASLADAQRAGASAALERQQLRSLAWSGVRIAMQRLASQRDTLLRGGRPEGDALLTQWELAGKPAQVRLIPLDVADTLLQAENARIDAVHAPRELLAAVAALGEAGADRLIAARAGPAANIDELAARAGLSHADLYGAKAGEPGLADLLTVFSFDPAVQRGVPPDLRTGVARIPFPGAISERGAQALRSRVGDAAAVIASLTQAAKPPTSRQSLHAGLETAAVPAASIDAALDLFAFSADPFEAGLINVNEAPVEVLRCIPGLDSAAAESIVNTRATMTPAARESVTWAANAVTPEQFRAMLPFITTRSLQWRARVEASISPPGHADATSDPGPVTARLVLEVVFDLAAARPRIASMKDVTYHDLAIAALGLRANDQGAEKMGEDQAGPSRTMPSDEYPVDPDPPEPEPEEPDSQAPPDPAPIGPPPPPRDVRNGRWRGG